MPSTQVEAVVSGGIPLVSGFGYSGSYQLIGGVQLKLSLSGAGPVYVGVPSLSGLTRMNSGIGMSQSGGLDDAMEVNPGDAYFIPRHRLVSGIYSVRVHAAAASSGARLYWEPM